MLKCRYLKRKSKFLIFLHFWSISDEFRSKIACENDVIQLICNPYSRIAVYGASFGRTEYESLQCGQPQGVREESKHTYSYNVVVNEHNVN